MGHMEITPILEEHAQQDPNASTVEHPVVMVVVTIQEEHVRNEKHAFIVETKETMVAVITPAAIVKQEKRAFIVETKAAMVHTTIAEDVGIAKSVHLVHAIHTAILS